MPRVTHVKRAQARYGTKPVIDPATGEQKRTPMTRKDGTQIVTKRGPKWLRVTERDLSKPLPNLRCDYPGCTIDGGEIKPGTAYKWIKPKSGPYGGRKRTRHAQHPSWMVWEYSDSLDARLAQIEYSATDGSEDWESEDDVQSALDELASQIEELASEWEEKAGNVEDGFGHPTAVSEELAETAENLSGWADEISGTTIPDLPEPEGEPCDACSGNGSVENPEYDSERAEGGENEEEGYDEPEEIDCEECNGTGEITPEEPTDEQMDAWREEAVAAVESAMERPF